ncbi:probable LRR receptor-like serine/threonine-protein kinase At1g56140 [Quercus lobata]|uniref:probable LRR receptor-like serine/threonine-protein kinase At1g56140 n=1 Tax=Quercus lobata TaxID=97700 RepID=UPI0012468A61|nr:probable LRR receptor-like serine/threonine-protein kinase At1g56140 [Quercus lobata]
MLGSNTGLTGRIPSFIGNWSKLQTLRLQGNSFEGPIPSSFSNLTSLTDLRIGDLSNGSSSLAFIKEMKSLSILYDSSLQSVGFGAMEARGPWCLPWALGRRARKLYAATVVSAK